MKNKYRNTNEYLYEYIAIWEKTEGVEFMKSIPLNGNNSPQILDYYSSFLSIRYFGSFSKIKHSTTDYCHLGIFVDY